MLMLPMQVPAALMNVVEEKSMKDSRKVDPYYFLFFSSFYQSITATLLFWTDIIPGFGMTSSIHEFGNKYVRLTHNSVGVTTRKRASIAKNYSFLCFPNIFIH